MTVRIYFLDSAGRRIGEKEFSPVLVTDFSIGDNTPLRPGYRKDFGYNLEDYAPSGWSKRVEVEIIDIEFLEKWRIHSDEMLAIDVRISVARKKRR